MPAPQAPQTSVSDRAVALPDQKISGVGFSKPAKPIELITPTATLQVVGQAEPEQVPQELVAGQDDPAGEAPYYRPATGQKLYAYRVKISDPAEQDIPMSTAAGGTVQDLTSVLTVGVRDQRLPIADNRAEPQTSFKINCGATAGSYPCRQKDGEFVILMTVPETSAISLQATVAKHRQSVALASGQLASSVSQVEYGRKKLTAKVAEKLEVPAYRAKVSVPDPDASDDSKSSGPGASTSPEAGKTDDKSSAPPTSKTKIKTERASWSMRVDSVAVSAFDPTRGWAPAGKAWLLVTTSKYARHDPDNAFTDNRVSSVTVTASGATYKPDALTDADFADGADLAGSSDVTWAFSVPDGLTEASLDFRPTGTVTADGVSTDYAVPKATAADLKLPQ